MMRKTGLMFVLILLLIVFMIPVWSHAAEWSFRDGVLTVTGTGIIGPYDSASSQSDNNSTAPWDKHRNEITKLVVGEGITDIGYMAFLLYPNLTEITLPSTLQRISNRNFDDCSIARINWGGTLNQWMSIYYYQYQYSEFPKPADNTMLSHKPTLYLGNGSDDSELVKEIRLTGSSPAADRYHFRNLANPLKLTVEQNYTKTIGEDAFALCDGLDSITLGSSAVSISSNSFRDVKAIVYYTPDDSWTNKIQDYGGILTWCPQTWSGIHERINGTDHNVSVMLTGDMKADDFQITIPYGKKVTVDLAGHTITCGGAGYFFFVCEGGELTILDTAGGGKLSGATSVNHAIMNQGTLILQGGSICNSCSVGITNQNTGIFIMTGGSITGNKKAGVNNFGVFTMSGGIISANGYCGVMITGTNACFRMKGGSITGHLSYGVAGYGTFEMTGGQVTGNSQGVDALGLYVHVGGKAVVTGNGSEEVPWNLYLGDGKAISVIKAEGGLAPEARIGVRLYRCPYAFISDVVGVDGTAYASAGNFTADVREQYIFEQDGKIGTAHRVLVLFDPGFDSDEESVSAYMIPGETLELPECSVTPPRWKHFSAWEVNGKTYAPGETVDIITGIQIIALWDYISGTMDAPNYLLPVDIREIGEESFAGTNAEVIFIRDIPEGETLVIRSGAFRNCTALRQIRIPERTVIEEGAFDNCDNVNVYGCPGGVAEQMASKYENAGFRFIMEENGNEKYDPDSN